MPTNIKIKVKNEKEARKEIEKKVGEEVERIKNQLKESGGKPEESQRQEQDEKLREMEGLNKEIGEQGSAGGRKKTSQQGSGVKNKDDQLDKAFRRGGFAGNNQERMKRNIEEQREKRGTRLKTAEDVRKNIKEAEKKAKKRAGDEMKEREKQEAMRAAKQAARRAARVATQAIRRAAAQVARAATMAAAQAAATLLGLIGSAIAAIGIPALIIIIVVLIIVVVLNHFEMI